MRFKGHIIPHTLTVIKEITRFKILVVKIGQFHELYIFEVGLIFLLPDGLRLFTLFSSLFTVFLLHDVNVSALTCTHHVALYGSRLLVHLKSDVKSYVISRVRRATGRRTN